MLSRRLCSIAVVLTLTILMAPVARAAEPETADLLVAKGVELRKKGDHAGALREFQAAHAKEPSGRTLAQMGIAEATLRLWTDAEDHISQALDSTSPWIEKNRLTLDQTLQTVRTHTAELSIYGPSGAVVSIEDKIVGEIPLPKVPRVNEGAITIKVESPGRRPFSQTISAKGGTRLIVTASLDLVPPEPIAPALAAPAVATQSALGHDTAPGPRPLRRWTGIALLTVGVAAVTWGIVWIAADGKSSWSNSDLVWNTRTPGWVILGAGVGAAAGGGYLLYSSRNSEVQVAATPTGFTGRF